MSPRARRLAPLFAAALLWGGCVSLEEEPLSKNAVGPDQRTLVLVFASPGPVYTEDDNKAETAAKIIPVLGLVVKSVQDDSATRRSKELQKYLPHWDPAAEFWPILKEQLVASSGHPGKFIKVSDAPELSEEKLRVYNRADDVLDWQLRYYYMNPDHPVPRNYSTLLTIDDALIFEVNLRWGVISGDADAATPTLSAVVKLIRADTSHVIWRHEDAISDDAGARTTYEFKVQPENLIAKYRKLMAPLAEAVVASYRKNLQTAGLFKNPNIPLGASTAPTAPPGSAPPSGAALPYGMKASDIPVSSSTTPASGNWVSPAIAYLNAHPAQASTTTASVDVSTPAVAGSTAPVRQP